MSKRYVYPQQFGERKKAKLDVTVSDHNFPLSQNAEPSKDVEQANNTWGDDNDDEILLLASQACEDAYNAHNSTLPNYSMCMQPSSTSTQISEPMPSTSKTKFNFKMPTFSPVAATSTNMRNNFKTISSPLPGTPKSCTMDGLNVSEDIIFKDNIYNGKDSDLYRKLLKLQEENAKLKSENDKLLDKCVTKEGESSILRTQLKTCQSAVDNARIEKIKAQEKLQIEWGEKLTAVNNQVQGLRNQLDFKNLEVINMKEKCKMLESNKVNLTQITLGGNDISMSQRHNNSMYIKQENMGRTWKFKTTSNSVQTDDKSHFLKLNIISREDISKLSQILPYIMERTTEQYPILQYNEKLKQQTDMQSKCRIFSTFHRLPTTPSISRETRGDIDLNCIYEDLSYIAAEKHEKENLDRFLNILKITKTALKNVQTDLEVISRRMTTAFQKEMDERYISSDLLAVQAVDLLSGRALYKEEQGIVARRMICVLYYLLNHTESKELFYELLGNRTGSNMETDIVNDIERICALLDITTCASLYSGLLTSVTLLLYSMATFKINKNTIKTIKNIIISRPMPFVNNEILRLLIFLSKEDILKDFCCKLSSGNLKVDYDQGVLLYKKDSCTLQILLRHSEVTLKCIEKQQNVKEAVVITRNLLKLYSHLSYQFHSQLEKNGCDCQLIFIQTIVFALRICAEFLNNKKYTELCPKQADMLSTCRSGAQLLQRALGRAGELAAGPAEGWLVAYCQLYAAVETEPVHCNMVSEIMSMYQVSSEELPQSYHSQAWLDSFNTFSLAD